MSFLVNEIYPCLQGEGANLGKPSVLVRLQICNLRCVWCDTPYTHTLKSDPASATDPKAGQRYQRLELNALVDKIAEHKIPHVILSGGEPTLQNLSLIADALGETYSFEVESNGTRIPHIDLPNFPYDAYKRFQWNISPKGKASGMEIVPAALEHWARLSEAGENVWFKFVVRKAMAQQDFEEVCGLVKTHRIAADRVMMMAEGTTPESQLSNVWLHDLCLQAGFRYTPRLHVLLFGNLRGV